MKKSRLIRKILGIALVFVLIGGMLGGLPALVSRVEASPATIYVPDDYPTIQAAVDAASPGDTIIVLPGTYSENVYINKENLTIQSRDGADETIVQAAFKVMALNVNVNGFTIKGGIFGVETFGNTVVRSSILCDNAWGIYLGSSSNNTIENNKFFNNRIADIDLRWSGNNLIKNCSFDLGLYIYGDYENKVESCTVGGKPLVFLNGERDKVIMKEAGQVILFKCMNVTVKECVFSNRAVGVELLQCTGCIVENNTFTYNPSRSIELFNSSDNVIQNNICRSNTGGIYLQYSSNNLVQGNKCSDSYDWQRAGIGVLYSSNNIIRNNTCSGNVIGILVEKSLGNAIYSNNLVNNGHNAFSDGSVGIWNSPEEMNYTYKGNTYTNYLGNYWSDYTGSDADGDGIGDTPYHTDGDNNDNYPLVEPFEKYVLGGDTVETGVEVGLGSTALSSQRKLVATSDGHLHVVYHREDGNGILQIYHAESSDGGATWTEEQVTFAARDQNFPALAVDSTDNLHLVWEDGRAGQPGIVPNTYYQKKTTSWQPAELVASYATVPSIAIDGNDNVHVVYGTYVYTPGYYGGGDGIRWRMRTSTGWQSEERLSSEQWWVRTPAIAIDTDNNVHVVWDHCPRYKYYDIHYRVRTSTGWGSEVEVNAETDNELGGYPSITIDSNNHAHIVWQHESGSDYTIKYREYTTSLQPTVDLEGPTTYIQYSPVIALDRKDHIHVVWSGQHSGSPTDYQLRYREYTTSWQPIENVTSSASDNQTNPNSMWANYPAIDGVKSNIPEDGYSFVWMDGTTIKYCSTCSEPPPDGAPIARASDITGQPDPMYPDTEYTVTAKYFDPDGRADLKYCYLRLRHPDKPLTMMWDEATDDFWVYAGEEGENYLTVSGASTEITEGGLEGYGLAWTFTINDQWPEVEDAIDFGVYAWDDSDLKSGWDYDSTKASFTVSAPTVDPAKSSLVADSGPIPADGFSASTITVFFRDPNDNPVPGKLVMIVTEPWVIIEQDALYTDENGMATAKIRSLREGRVDVTAKDLIDDIALEMHASVEFYQVWYAFDGHIHTHYSDAHDRASVMERAQTAKEVHLDMVTITDHEPMLEYNPLTTAEEEWTAMKKDCTEASNGILVAPGEEIGTINALGIPILPIPLPKLSTGHYLAYGINGFVKGVDQDWAWTNASQENINQVHSKNGFGFIAHPYMLTMGPHNWWPWPKEEWDCTGFAGLELLNGEEKIASDDTLARWGILMSDRVQEIRKGDRVEDGRKRWIAIGCSDAHSASEIGRSRTYIYLDGAQTIENMYGSLKKGQAVASHGPMVTFEISLLDANGEEIGNPAKIGEILEANVGQKARLHIAWDTMDSFWGLEGIYIAGTLSPELNGKAIEEATGDEGYIEHDIELTSAGYLRIEARLADGRTAYTNPIFIDAKGISAAFDLLRERSIPVELLEVKKEYAETTASWADAIFRIDWPGSKVGLTLIDPNGLVITPDSQPVNIYHEAGPTYAFYQVTEPVPGTWTMRIEGVDVPSGGETVNLRVWSRISTKPQVEILQPTNGANVSGLVNIPVNASDKEGISELTCYIDGIMLGTGTNPPYDFSWDSTSAEDGAHLITVWLTDVDGNTVGDSAQVYVVNHPELQPVAEAGEDKWVMVGEKIVFDGSASEGQEGVLYTYAWDFGNGDSAMGQTVEYAYSNPGTYNATLFMWDEKGNFSTDDLVVVVQIPATIDFDPDTLYLKSKDNYVTAYIELPPGFDVRQIDIPSIRLNGVVPALTKPTKIGDYDRDRVRDLMVKFDAPAVKSLLTPGNQVEITITGEVAGIAFEGNDIIRVISP